MLGSLASSICSTPLRTVSWQLPSSSCSPRYLSSLQCWAGSGQLTTRGGSEGVARLSVGCSREVPHGTECQSDSGFCYQRMDPWEELDRGLLCPLLLMPKVLHSLYSFLQLVILIFATVAVACNLIIETDSLMLLKDVHRAV